MKGYGIDILGNIALLKFSKETKVSEKKKISQNLLKKNKSVTTILEKTGKFKGRLRKQETKFLLGIRTKEVLYRENGCFFRFNLDLNYFSPRLSNERKEIAKKIKKNEEVLVMFSGVGPFSIVIAKLSKVKKVFSNEISKEANKYAKLNIELNKVKDKIEIVSGDIRKISDKINKKFDVIVMPRPQLKDSFLLEAFKLSKKGTRIYYYDFCGIDEKKLILDKIKNEAEKSGKKIKILKTKVAGEVAPYKIRLRVDLRVLG